MKEKMALSRMLLIVLGLWLANSTRAQTTTPPPQQATEQQATRMTQDLQQQLNLTETQTNQVAAINRRTIQERQQVQENQKLTRQERREQLQQIQARRTQEINALLTAPQRSRFAEHQRVQQSPKVTPGRNQPPGRQPAPGKKPGGRGRN
jgi:hypothetical protein